MTFDYGNNIRTQAQRAGVENAFDIPGFVPEYIRPLFCEGKGPFRWAALSGDPEDIRVTDALALEMFARRRGAVPLDSAGARACRVPGVARAHLLARIRRARALRAGINDLVRAGAIKAPIVIGRDHLDTGSVASPYRETEGMRDGSDAIADWPMLNALLNTSAGATWVSVHHGGGVGIGYSLHAGMVIVADGSRDADEKLERVLTCDPGMGVVRHADAGYPEAIDTARARASYADAARAGPHVIRERTASSTRARACRRSKRSAARSRIPVVLGGCGTGRTCCCSGCASGLAAARRSTSTSNDAPRRPSAFFRRVTGVIAVPVACRRAKARDRARGVRHAARVLRYGARARRRAVHVPARRSSSCGHSRASRACVTCCAISSRGWRPARNRFVLTTRYIARAHRLLRDATSRFEVMHSPR